MELIVGFNLFYSTFIVGLNITEFEKQKLMGLMSLLIHLLQEAI